MKKKFTKYLSICMVFALVLIVGFIFLLQTYTIEEAEEKIFSEKLASIEVKIQENETEAENLKQSLGEASLAKARALAAMLEQDITIIDSKSKADKLCELLIVDEVHVIDEKGILRYGNVESFYGFDFASGEQTKPFLDILKDESMEIVQEPQPNAAEGTLFQYIGVARQDQKGVVQIGVRPEVLEEILENNKMQNVTSAIEVGTTGYAFAIQKADGIVAGFPETALIGKTYTELGFSEGILDGKEERKVENINGQEVFYGTKEYADYIIGVAIPTKELFLPRKNQTILFAVIILLVFVSLIFVIRLFLSKIVVNDIKYVVKKLDDITGGDLETVISAKTTEESKSLSNSINSMVSSIKRSVEENEKSAGEKEDLLEQQNNLFADIKSSSDSIAQFSKKTSSISKTIHSGTLEQFGYLENLQGVMKNLTEQSKENATVSETTAKISFETVQKMEEANQNMQDMMRAMKQIASASEKIENIIQNIDEIAEQTNLLALNASIEAARAGEGGRGFSVVADQVGILAKQSAEAAKQTGELIQNSLTAIQQGDKMASKAIETFLQVVENSRQTGEAVEGLCQTSQAQVELVTKAECGMNDIARVIEINVSVSQESEQASEELANEAEQLKILVQ